LWSLAANFTGCEQWTHTARFPGSMRRTTARLTADTRVAVAVF
jgi:hypothetical protein